VADGLPAVVRPYARCGYDEDRIRLEKAPAIKKMHCRNMYCLGCEKLQCLRLAEFSPGVDKMLLFDATQAVVIDGTPGRGWDFITDNDTGVLRHHATGHAVVLTEGSNGWLDLKLGDTGPELTEYSSGNTHADQWDADKRKLLSMLTTSPGAHPLSKWLGSATNYGNWKLTLADGGLVLLHNSSDGESPENTRCLAAHGYERARSAHHLTEIVAKHAALQGKTAGTNVFGGSTPATVIVNDGGPHCAARRQPQVGPHVCMFCKGRFTTCYGSYGVRNQITGTWRAGTSADLSDHPESPNTQYCTQGCEKAAAEKAAAAKKAAGEKAGVQAPLQDGVTEVGHQQFANDKHQPPITFATIPSSVTVIRYGAFQGCRKLTTVSIPSSVKEIGEQAFWSCDSLSSVNIPASVQKIGKRAFLRCPSLTSIDIPSSVTTIGDEAFSECYALKTATIPSSATLGKDVFPSGTQVTVVSGFDQRAQKAAAEQAATAKKAADEKAAAEKAAAEKAAAEKAAVEKAAFERAAAAAGAEAAALRRELEAVRAAAEKTVAEAKAAAEKVAAEAKAAAEKVAAEKAAAEKAAAEKAAARAKSAQPKPTAEPAAEPAAQLQGLQTALFLLFHQWGLRSDAPAAGSAPPEWRAVRSQLPESWNAQEIFAVPGVITEQMTQTVKSRVLSHFMPEGVQFKDFYPEVVISYASGRRSGRDCEGAGPGMYYAASILGLLHERGVRCFSGLHVPPGTDWEVFMLRLNSRRAQAKVLIVLLTAALFESKPCLKEINTAIKRGIPVLPIRFEDKLPGHKDQWARFTDEDSELMVYRVQEHLSKVNSIPHPGTVLTVPDSMNTILGLVDKYLGIDRAHVSPGNHGDESYEA